MADETAAAIVATWSKQPKIAPYRSILPIGTCLAAQSLRPVAACAQSCSGAALRCRWRQTVNLIGLG